MKKLKLIGLRNLPLEGEIENQKDYKISVIASLEEIRQKPSQGEDKAPEQEIFVMKAINVDCVEEVGTHKEVKIGKGFTSSQCLKFSIQDYFDRMGLNNTEEDYRIEMEKIIKSYNQKV